MTRLLLPLTAAALLAACASKPATPTQPLTPYTCHGSITNMMSDTTTYRRHPAVILDINGTKSTLVQTDDAIAEAPGGTRYTTARTNPAKPGSLVWWTKGSDAILYEVKSRANGSNYESQLANCTSNPQPIPMQAPATLPVPQPESLPGTIPGTAPGGYYAPQPAIPTQTI